MTVGRQAWQRRRLVPDAATSKAQQVLDQIELVPPWTTEEFSAWISETYSREVVLRPWERASSAGEQRRCGLLIVTNEAFFVSYDDNRSPRHQRQQIFHEFGHILCGHTDSDGQFFGDLPRESTLIEGLDPAMVQHVLHRGAFDTDEERTAELVGTHLAVLSRQQRGTGKFDRIASAFFEPVKR
ncbi:ImmA/IrrE family metallo-endopeptidase [Gordonia sp. (in: high G+C Gram-positive bacteria)]|uniref:ImmA/IrrE family metallo-endopeptidase n=1 Tax=Gordonia sp. (in: high G+C Gram-positive bacteria) TaxID=84139 RepID=UPI003C7484E5